MKNITRFYSIDSIFDSRNNVFKNAYITIDEDGTKTLYSLESPICEVTPDHILNIITEEPDIITPKTTSRHLKEFLRQEGFKPELYKGKNIFEKAKKIEAETHKF